MESALQSPGVPARKPRLSPLVPPGTFQAEAVPHAARTRYSQMAQLLGISFWPQQRLGLPEVWLKGSWAGPWRIASWQASVQSPHPAACRC